MGEPAQRLIHPKRPAAMPPASPSCRRSCAHAPTLSTKAICTCDNPCAILHHALQRAANMPRFYFHLSAPDQDFPDNIGSDVTDLAAAHSIAVRLMKRVMMISAFADCAPDLRRWTVEVTDERRRPFFHRDIPNIFCPKRMEACFSQRCPCVAPTSRRDKCS